MPSDASDMTGTLAETGLCGQMTQKELLGSKNAQGVFGIKKVGW